MPYKDPIKEKARSLKRRRYFRERYYKLKGLKTPDYFDQRRKLAYKGENIALKILTGSEQICRPSDLFWKGKLVEVKTAKKVLTGKSRNYRWKFCLTQLHKVDLFFFVCEDLSKKVQYIFLIPDKLLKIKNFTISESKINKYSSFLLTL